jgi:hypothetical protein
VGQGVSFETTANTHHEASPEDSRILETELHKVSSEQQDQSTTIAKPIDTTTLTVGKTAEEESLDEIYIDIRGNIHRPGEEADTDAQQTAPSQS